MKYELEFVDSLEKGFGGKVFFPSIFGRIIGKKCIIKILKKYENDTGLFRHELKHVEQFSNDFLHSLKYKFSKSFRYKIELEAYNEQIKEYKYSKIEQCDWIIESLTNKYDLDVSIEKATSDIESILIISNLKSQ